MNFIGFIFVLMGIVYLFYSVLKKNTITIYNKREDMVILNSFEFFKLQLYFSIISSLYLIVYGVVLIIFDPNNILFIVTGAILFRIMNYFLTVLCKKKGYIKYS